MNLVCVSGKILALRCFNIDFLEPKYCVTLCWLCSYAGFTLDNQLVGLSSLKIASCQVPFS